MQMAPYLCFAGQCEEAFNFYKDCFSGSIPEIHRFGGSPMADQVPAEFHQHVMHVTLIMGNGQVLMGSDAMPGQPFDGMKGITLALNPESLEEAERLFNTLAEGGSVQMPLDKTFWAERFGMMTDRFGTPWMVNYEGNPA